MSHDANYEAALLKQTSLKWDEAIEKNLVEEMGQYMHKDWIIFSGDGNITTKEAFLRSVQQGNLKHSKMDFEVLRVQVFENTGLVMQRGTSAGAWQGQSFENYEIASSVFIKEGNHWLAVQTMLAPANKATH
jgi:hypothetical protein